MLPDIDVLGIALGVDYGDPWGHRGATHSLTLSVLLGVVVGLAARHFKRPPARTALIASMVLASHALLDTMTDGGLGCALFWPFDLTRFFAPWRPIPVSPIGLDFLSRYGAVVALAELVLFAPVLLFALRSPSLTRSHAGVFLAGWVASLTILSRSDATRDAVIGFILRDDTNYSSGFSEAAFRTIAPGQSEAEVRQRLGQPFAEYWFYTPRDPRPPDERPDVQAPGCLAVRFEAGVAVALHDAEACTLRGVQIGLSPGDVNKRLGSPSESCWQYSRGPGGARYRQRLVCFWDTSVHMVVRKWNW